MLNFGDTKALRVALVARNDKNFQSGDVHQSIVDICYEKWQSMDDGSYADMVSWARMQYGPLAAFMVLAGGYHNQVCNGGHEQYYGNGYADGDGGCFSERDESMPLHKKMLGLFSVLGLLDFDIAKKVFEIAKDMKVNPRYGELNSFGTIVDEDEEQLLNGEELDDKYYEICEDWMRFLNGLLCDTFKPSREANAPA